MNDKQSVKHNISTNEWYEHFKQLFTSTNTNSVTDKGMDNSSPAVRLSVETLSEVQILSNDILDSPISRKEISESIRYLKTNKAAGIDNILPEFIKNADDILLPYLELLFNVILETGQFPSSWTIGIIIPIHKSGNINNVDNYRGINLLSILGKVFTHIINKRLTFWADILMS